MFGKTLGAAALIAAATAFGASAATVTNFGTNTDVINYDGAGSSSVNLGTYNLGAAPISVQALFTSATSINGSFAFTVVNGMSGSGSVDVNIKGVKKSDVTASINGTPLSFSMSSGDLTAVLFLPTDPAEFMLSFKGGDRGDQIQLNLAAIPLPAGGLLLLSGLGAVGVARRRKSKAKA